jgi:hypothetical protein
MVVDGKEEVGTYSTPCRLMYSMSKTTTEVRKLIPSDSRDRVVHLVCSLVLLAAHRAHYLPIWEGNEAYWNTRRLKLSRRLTLQISDNPVHKYCVLFGEQNHVRISSINA